MLIGDVRPTTLNGIKSLAAQLRKERGIKHSVALDLAAKAADFANFRNAQRTLPARAVDLVRPYVLLTMYWRDKEEGYRCGRETLKIELSQPVLDICGKIAVKGVRGLGDFRMVADDHFVCDWLAGTQGFAREHLCTSERSLRFMEYTGLLPSRGHRKAHSNSLGRDKLPGKDHATYWVDPASGQFVLVDEPYGGAPDEAKRAAWASRTGWRIIKTAWPGMYSPYDCDLYVVADGRTDYDLDALVSRIDAIPDGGEVPRGCR